MDHDPQRSFGQRWLVLGMISLATSLLLTVALALLNLRGTASASQPTERPAATRSSGTTLVTIGGLARTPTPAAGSAPASAQPPQTAPEPARPIMAMRPDTTESRPVEPVAPSTSGGDGAALPSIAAAPRAPEAATSDQNLAAIEATGATSIAPAPPARTSQAGPPATAAASPTPTIGYTPMAAPPTSTPTGVATATPPPTQTPAPTATLDAPPSISVQLSDNRVDKGSKVTIAVAATDDRGLDWISWKSLDDSEDPELGSEHRSDCREGPRCTEIWTVTPKQAGTYRLRATARDLDGQRDTATVELRVRETTPPTRTPTAGLPPTRAR